MEFVGNKKTACFCGSAKCSGSIGEKPKEPEKKAKLQIKLKRKLKRKPSATKVQQPEKIPRSVEDVIDPLISLLENGKDPLVCLLEKMPEKHNALQQKLQEFMKVDAAEKSAVIENFDVVEESVAPIEKVPLKALDVVEEPTVTEIVKEDDSDKMKSDVE